MNVFVVNTPFQLYVVKHIILQYFSSDKNLIVSTIKKGKYNDVISVTSGIKGLFKTRNLLWKIKRNISDISFVVPHMGNLFSSYFFDLSREYNRPISVYYEGIALFYDPVIANKKAKYKRMLLGLLLGIRYKHYEQLYPQSFVNAVDYCYSPTTKLLEKYKMVRILSFKSLQHKKRNGILFLTSDEINHHEIVECVKLIEKLNNTEISSIYIKPHYSLDGKSLHKFVEMLKNTAKCEIVILENNIPIEQYFEKLQFKHMICQRFTSAIVNIKFIYKDEIECIVVNKENTPMDMLKGLDVNIKYYN